MPITLRGADSVYNAVPPTRISIPATAKAGDLAILSLCGRATYPPATPPGWTSLWATIYGSMGAWAWSRTLGASEGGTAIAVETSASAGISGASIVVLAGAGTILAHNQSAGADNISPSISAAGDRVHLSFWHQRSGTANISVSPPAGMELFDYATGTGGTQVSSAVAGNLTPTREDLPAGSWVTPNSNLATIVSTVAVEVLPGGAPVTAQLGVWSDASQSLAHLTPYEWFAVTQTMEPLTLLGAHTV